MNFSRRRDELLGYPKLDPHGSPIPDKTGKMEWIQYETLSSCKAGDQVKLAAVTRSSDEFLKFLNSRELKLGIRLKIRSVEVYDGTMVISYGKHREETLSAVVCEKLLVLKS